MLKYLILCLFYVILAGCSSVNSSNYVTTEKTPLSEDQKILWKLMVGTWYGNQPVKSGGYREHIMTRRLDGTYLVRTRHVTKDGIRPLQTEVGHWGIVGPVYFSIFRGWAEDGNVYPSNPSDPYNYDAYNVITLNSDIFRYRSYSSGTIFEVTKVPKDFEFPDIVNDAL